MPRIFGSIDVNDRWFSTVNLNQTRTFTGPVGAGVSRVVWQLDDASFTDPAEQFRLDILESTDGGASFVPVLSATYNGGSKGRDGQPPSGMVDVNPAVTHLRATLTPTAGRPRVGIYGTVI